MGIHICGEQYKDHFHWNICGCGPDEYNIQVNTQIMYFRIRTKYIGYFWCILQLCNLWSKDLFIAIREYSMVSAVVRHVKLYTTSKVFYQTALGLNFFLLME